MVVQTASWTQGEKEGITREENSICGGMASRKGSVFYRKHQFAYNTWRVQNKLHSRPSLSGWDRFVDRAEGTQPLANNLDLV